MSVLLTHWGGWTVSFAGDTTTQIIVFYQKAFGFLLWGGGGIHPGVIIFIVLSGFCIHLPQAVAPDRLNSAGFWRIYALRRTGRILPVFWVALLLGVISVWLMGTEYSSKNGYGINGDLFFSIFGVAEIARFFGATALYPGNGPLSTVAVEMLLYASYPLFLIVHKRYGLTGLMGFGLLLYFSIIMARWLGVEPSSLHGSWFEFVIYWIIGAVSAGVYAARVIRTKDAFMKLGLIIACGYLFHLSLISFVHIKGFHVVTTLLLALITGCLLIFLLTLECNLNRQQTKISKYMAMLGERSYSLYVVHTPIIISVLWVLNTQINPSLHVANYPLLTLLAVVIATELMFRYVERPSHYYARRIQLASVASGQIGVGK